jgi:hypothetical protein
MGKVAEEGATNVATTTAEASGGAKFPSITSTQACLLLALLVFNLLVIAQVNM